MWRPFAAILVIVFCILLLGCWLWAPLNQTVSLRVPIPENNPDLILAGSSGDIPGRLASGIGVPSSGDTGAWPQFRGAHRDGVATGSPIREGFPEDGPEVLWRISVGEGHAGAAIHSGCVYLLDYDEQAREDVVRRLALWNGEDIWRYSYPVRIKRNHGMSRTVPAVNDEYVVTIGPMGHVHCLKAASGELVWSKDLTRDYGTRIPEWYAGQCPLIEPDRVILAPVGKKYLMTAIDLATEEAIWETPNDLGWEMT
ncbi:MAG TPA: PQQ-binding-like beta-propeller repeat protein, partial [bacterium]|nr:PQQ-binding-like beta-propeller repeat protein [bacterium]